jgi:hypothetical protein
VVRFNLKLNPDNIVLKDDYINYIMPSEISFNNIDDNTYKNIGNLIEGISENNICFEVTRDRLQLWTEPYKAGIEMFTLDPTLARTK